MNFKTFPRLILSLAASLLTLFPASSAVTVETLEEVAGDLSARTNPRHDKNDNLCALVRVALPVDGVLFQGNVIDQFYEVNEYMVYLSPGTKMMRIKIPNQESVDVRFNEVSDIPSLDSGQTYLLRLSGINLLQTPVSIATTIASTPAAVSGIPGAMAVVDIQEILRNHPEAKKIDARIEELRKSYQQELDRLTREFQKKYREYNDLPTDAGNVQRDRIMSELTDLQTKINSMEEGIKVKLEEERQSLLAPLREKISKTIDNTAVKGGFISVMDKESVLYYADPSTDLTSKIESLYGFPGTSPLDTPKAAPGATTRLGIVRTNQLIPNLPETKNAQEELNRLKEKYESEYSSLTQDLQRQYDELQKIMNSSSADNPMVRELTGQFEEAQRKIENYQQEATQSMERRQQELMEPIKQKVLAAIKRAADAAGFNYIIDDQQTIDVESQDFDLTDLVAYYLGTGGSSKMPSPVFNGRVAVIDTDKLIMSMSDTKKVQEQLAALQAQYEKEFEGHTTRFQNLYAEYQNMGDDVSADVKERKITEIQQAQQQADAFSRQATEELQKRQQELMAPIIQKAHAAIISMLHSDGYDFALDPASLLFFVPPLQTVTLNL